MKIFHSARNESSFKEALIIALKNKNVITPFCDAINLRKAFYQLEGVYMGPETKFQSTIKEIVFTLLSIAGELK